MTVPAHPLESYVRKHMIPHIWCSGCGHGIVMSEFLAALKELEYDMNNVAVISGIGCMGRVAGHINADSFHTTHGRAIALALGAKVARPDLKFVVISGDGDLFAIGGNHLIHAARRNVDLTVICANNFIYGMTGGQLGPTTPLDAYTTTTPYKNIEQPFNLPLMAAAAGAVYVARWTAIHIRRIRESIKKALQKRGFTFVEVISPCPEIFGRRNRMRETIDEIMWLKEKSVIQHHIDPSMADIGLDRIVVGEFVDIERPEYTDLIRQRSREVMDGLEKEGRLTNAKI